MKNYWRLLCDVSALMVTRLLRRWCNFQDGNEPTKKAKLEQEPEAGSEPLREDLPPPVPEPAKPKSQGEDS
jgi:hypothetical protein